MSRLFVTDKSRQPDEPEFESGRGLIDPRAIHPSPEDVIPDPSESPGTESSSGGDATPEGEDLGPGRAGIVDPRIKPIGPDV